MYIGYDEKQEALRKGCATTTTNCSARDPGCACGRGRTGPVHREIVGKMGRDGWLTVGWPRNTAVRLLRRRTVRDVRRVCGHRRTDPDAHGQHRRPDPDAVRHPGAEGLLPAEDLPGEITFCVGYSNPMPAPTSLRCSAEPSATATSSSSTARRPGPRSPGTPITSGSQHGRTPT